MWNDEALIAFHRKIVRLVWRSTVKTVYNCEKHYILPKIMRRHCLNFHLLCTDWTRLCWQQFNDNFLILIEISFPFVYRCRFYFHCTLINRWLQVYSVHTSSIPLHCIASHRIYTYTNTYRHCKLCSCIKMHVVP